MELSENNFFREVFMLDNLPAGSIGIYEAPIGIPRIIVDHLTDQDQLRVQDFGNHIIMERRLGSTCSPHWRFVKLTKFTISAQRTFTMLARS